MVGLHVKSLHTSEFENYNLRLKMKVTLQPSLNVNGVDCLLSDQVTGVSDQVTWLKKLSY